MPGAADTARLIAELTLKDKLSAGVTSAIKSVDKLDKRLNKVGSIASKGFSNAARNIEKAALGIGVAFGGAIVGAVKVAGDFEAQLNTINTIARETPEALGKIGDQIRQVARDTGTPLEDLTQGYYDLLSAGIQAADSQKVLVAANTLAVGGLSSTAEAIDLLTTTINTYGGDATKAASYSDVFAKAIERGKVTAAEFAGSFATIGPTAAGFGIEVEEIGASFARLTAAGVPASEAATQMAAAIKALAKPGGPLKALQKETGKSYLEIAGKQGLVTALEQMRVDADKAGVPLINLFGRLEGFNFALQTTGPNFDAYNADLAAMGDAAGTAAAQMSERQQGLNFQLGRLKAGIKDAGITIGSALIPKLVPLIEKLNTFLGDNQEGIKRFGQDLANAFEQGANFVSKLDFKQIGDSLKVAGTFAKTLVQAFLAAPQWLQTAVITGWGLNKLTGGAVTGIFGELGKGLFKGIGGELFKRGGSPANPMYVSDVAGGLGGAAGKTGFLGTLLKGVFPAAVILGIGTAIGGVIVEALGGQLKPEEKGTGREVNVLGLPLTLGRNEAALVRLESERQETDKKLINEITGFRMDLQDDRINQATGFWTSGVFSRPISKLGMDLASKVTAMQHILHAALQTAIGAIETSNDPAAIVAAIDQALNAVKGGAGSAGTTKGLIDSLKTQLAAAEAANNPDLAAKIKSAIAQLEPFAKGRQWQAEQIQKARDIVASSKSVEDKTRELATIERDLLSHQRTMAADIVASLSDVVNAVKNIKINAFTGEPQKGPTHAPGTGPLKSDPGPSGAAPGSDIRNGFTINANVSFPIRDVNTSQTLRGRIGPTPTQAGSA